MKKTIYRDIECYQKGVDPKLLITSGVHGDEFGIIEPVRKMVTENVDSLGDFIYIPIVTPSAVGRKTRENARGTDPNRQFLVGTSDEEAAAVMRILDGRGFDLHLDFHEDPSFDSFYLYDSPPVTDPVKIQVLLLEIKGLGVRLLDGLDDPDDPVLGNMVVGGYTHFNLEKDDFSLESWLRFSGRAKQTIVPEIPGKAPQEIKSKIVEAIFRYLIL